MSTVDLDLDVAVPTCRVGFIEPLNKIDLLPYEFYRLAPDYALASLISIGLQGLAPEDARAAVADGRAEACIEDLLRRKISFVCLNGVPLGLNLGSTFCRDFVTMCRERYDLDSCVSLDAAVEAFRALGATRPVAVNKWNSALNVLLKEALAEQDIDLVGTQAVDWDTKQGQGAIDRGITTAASLVEKALAEHPDADSIYLVGGAWLMLPLIRPLEEKFGIPVVAGLQSKIWYALNRANGFVEKPEYGQLMNIRLGSH
ncbi:MAG TPA: hypothetical protein VGJ28_00405 [Micromonosporaceae bacterium]|jgi:maleate cis-trans isomerase